MNRLPSLFVSHGAPTFALEPGLAGPRLTALGRSLPRPQAIAVISPHWMTAVPRVSTAQRPVTVHDFGGFDPALYRLGYPAHGHPSLAQRAVTCLEEAGWPAQADARRGLDHGAWVPLMHLFPAADVPVFQVSLPSRLDAPGALAFGRALAPLADEGVLIVGSGSLTHNLYEFGAGFGPDEPYVAAFSAWVREAVEQGDADRLLRTLDEAPEARRAHPTPEHFWPLLVAAGAADAGTGVPPATVIEGRDRAPHARDGCLRLRPHRHGALRCPGSGAGCTSATTASPWAWTRTPGTRMRSTWRSVRRRSRETSSGTIRRRSMRSSVRSISPRTGSCDSSRPTAPSARCGVDRNACNPGRRCPVRRSRSRSSNSGFHDWRWRPRGVSMRWTACRPGAKRRRHCSCCASSCITGDTRSSP
ncbi:MAG: class III extradiol ring-cleavage dioxygenase [Burkholderiaceae bacterium]